MSWTSRTSWTTGADSSSAASRSRRSSGTAAIATFGSIVVNGYPAASAPAWVRALKRVDLPALGIPTMPTFIAAASPASASSPASGGSGQRRPIP